MGTVEVAYCSLDGFIVCWMGTVGMVDCLLDGSCGSG